MVRSRQLTLARVAVASVVGLTHAAVGPGAVHAHGIHTAGLVGGALQVALVDICHADE